MRKYLFRGLYWYDKWEEICVEANSIEDAWHYVAINYPEFIKIKFVREEK